MGRRGGSRTALYDYCPYGLCQEDMTLNHYYDPERHHRRSVRLPGYDYAEDGAYYVTLVTRERALLFGDVVDGEMKLSAIGQLVLNGWEWLSNIRTWTWTLTWSCPTTSTASSLSEAVSR